MDKHKLETLLGADQASELTDEELTRLASHLRSEKTLENMSATTLQDLFPELSKPAFGRIRDTVIAWQKQRSTAAAGVQAGPSAAAAQAVDRATQRLMDVTEHLQAGIERLVLVVKPKVSIIASDCKSATIQQVMRMLGQIIDLKLTCTAPCCMAHQLRPLRTQQIPRFTWPEPGENHKINVRSAVSYMDTYLLPAGMFAWPVQGINWLPFTLDCGDAGSFHLDKSQTDYILFMAGPNNVVRDLVTALSQVTGRLNQHLLLLVPYMVALVEAKKPAKLAQSPDACRCQALMEYVAVNQALTDTAPMPVLLSDFNFYHCLHYAGTTRRALDNKEVQCVHIASPQNLPPLPERRPATPATAAQPAALAGPEAGPAPAAHPLPASAAQVNTMQFVQTLLAVNLETRQRETAGRPFPTLEQTTSDPHDPGDNGGHGGGNMEEEDSGDGGDGNHQEAGDTTMHGEAIAAAGVVADCVRTHEQEQRHNRGCFQLDFQVSPLHISAKASSSGSSHGVPASLPHDGSEHAGSEDSGSPDEGLLEAAVDNAKAQQFMAFLRHPAVYRGLGLSQAPRWYTPVSREEFWGACRLLPLDQDE